MDYKFLKNREQLDNLAQKRAVVRPNRTEKRKKIFLTALGLALIVGGLVYFFVYSPVFKIKRITIEGMKEVNNLNTLQSAVKNYTDGHKYLFAPKDNILFLSIDDLVVDLMKKVPMEEIIIKKKWPNELVISGEEKSPVLLWKEEGWNYYMDKNGVAMAVAQEKDIKYDLISINSIATSTVMVGKSIVNPSLVNYILRVLPQMKSALRGWPISRIELKSKDSKEISFYTNEGWYVIVAVDEELEKPLADLLLFLRQEGENTKKLQYVDLRIQDKIFYK